MTEAKHLQSIAAFNYRWIKVKMVSRSRTMALILLYAAVTALSQKLFIFLPSEVNAIEIDARYAEALPEFTIKSFSNVTDFRKIVAEEKPDGIITKPQLTARLAGYTVCLDATINKSTTESFSILSVDKALSVNEITGKSIGILDFMGKKDMDSLVQIMTNAKPVLTRVKKMADLLPLLNMNMVSAVLVSTNQIAYLKQRSQMTFIISRCNCSIGIAVLAVSHENKALIARVKFLPSELGRLIGIDAWQDHLN